MVSGGCWARPATMQAGARLIPAHQKTK